jgi:hypothetical protein
MVELVIVSLVVVGLLAAFALQARSKRADRALPDDPSAQPTRRDDHSGYGPA